MSNFSIPYRAVQFQEEARAARDRDRLARLASAGAGADGRRRGRRFSQVLALLRERTSRAPAEPSVVRIPVRSR